MPGPASQPTPVSTPAKLPRKRSAELDLLMQDMEVLTADLPDDDDFRIFVETPLFRIDCSPLEWWARAEQKSHYPQLHNMAIAILSIPAESSEPERAFCGSRRTYSRDRLSLSCNNVQKIECIGCWIRHGHIRLYKLNGMGLEMEAIIADDDDGLDDEVLDVDWI